jgi:alternative ribosome-rescue factor|tara:strand:- start:1249 stop:1440 length:192 start_codon:yes stop_codon:yes gene_type:complete
MPAQAGIFKRMEKTMKQRKIKDNALKAQLRTPMFKMQQQTPKKGKGSYSRKGRNSLGGHRQAA